MDPAIRKLKEQKKHTLRLLKTLQKENFELKDKFEESKVSFEKGKMKSIILQMLISKLK